MINKLPVANKKTISEVIVYHDQTKDFADTHFKGHVFLFVPYKVFIKDTTAFFGTKVEHILSRQSFFEKISFIRSKYNAIHKLHFTNISGKVWSYRNAAEKEIIELSEDALRIKNTKIFQLPLFCKLAVIFYPTKQNLDLYGGKDKQERQLRYDETLMRMLLKGAAHFLYDENNCVRINKIISDGNPHHRQIDSDRILSPLIYNDLLGKGPLRDYVEISKGAGIIQQDSQHRNYTENSDEFIDANMLQVSDMLLGSVIYSCYKKIIICGGSQRINCKVKDKKSIIAYPIKKMLDKRKRGRDFIHSGHYSSFTLSVASIDRGEWQFENIMTKEVEIDNEIQQTSLFNLDN